MTGQSYIRNFIVAQVTTLKYSLLILVSFVINYLKNPFRDPWAQKLRLEPPAALSDPKYGVHKYIKVNNIKMHYVESGDPSKALMIFVHGFPEFWYSWRHQIVEFSKDYWCIAVDQRGYGDSEKPDSVSDYKIEELIKDLRDLVSYLGREKCILISHDWGGLVAAKFRDVYPECTEALVMLSSATAEAWSKKVWTDEAQFKKSWYIFLMQMPYIAERWVLMNDLEVFNLMMQIPGKDVVTEQDVECYKYWFGKPSALTPPVNYYRANFSYGPLENKRKEENIPMLVAYGQNEIYLDHSLLNDMKEDYATIETTIIDNCAHFAQQEEPEKVNTVIRDFLKKHNL